MQECPAVIEALVQVARKRKLLGRGASRRLGDQARRAGVTTLAELRRWLDDAPGLSPQACGRMRDLLAPDTMPPFGQWRAVAHLADGGMGRVWMAEGPGNRLVVVKTVRDAGNAAADVIAERRQRFLREARIMMQIQHPNVVRCMDTGEQEDGTLYLVLEYVDCGDLRDLVEARGRLSEPLALAIVHQVATGLGEAHRLHIVHRDIKPSNIFVARDGAAQLADFGVARSTEDLRTALTLAGAVVGSPHYMSPEQVLGERDLDGRSDIYALGAVLHYCLAGKPPFEGKAQEVMHHHLTDPPPDVRTLNEVVSDRSAAVIGCCMEKLCERRPGDAASLVSRIEHALGALGYSLGRVIQEEETGARHAAPGESDEIGILELPPAPAASPAPPSAPAAPRAHSGEELLTGTFSAFSDTPLRAEPLAAQGPLGVRGLTASLIGEGTITAVARPPGATPGSDTAAQPATDIIREPLRGDLAQALAGEWIDLVPVVAGEAAQVMLHAQTRVVLGKLKDAPVDICLRNYPVQRHREALTRISRQHLALVYDALDQRLRAEDLGSSNGTVLDGEALLAGKPRALAASEDHRLVVAGTVVLDVRLRRARARGRLRFEGVPPLDGVACGLEVDHVHDAVVIGRPENRPELAYAMVLRRLSGGGPGSDLAIAGARSLASVILARYGGRWIWRTAAADGWSPLCEGQELDCGGWRMIARPGSHDHV